jgi:peptidyl-prolyl cis-trans isomerase B (cyclophilin B)
MKKFAIFPLSLIILSLLFFNCHSKAEDSKKQGDKKVNPQYVITVTSAGRVLGDITVELWPEEAPKTVANFDSLVKIGFFDGTAFHRVIPGFVIQGGDPNSKNKPKETWGQGDPSQKKVPAEFGDIHHERGILSMARRGNDVNSNTSQFFICLGSLPNLDGQYTVFGKVLEGMDVVDAVVDQPRDGDFPKEKIEMKIKKK